MGFILSKSNSSDASGPYANIYSKIHLTYSFRREEWLLVSRILETIERMILLALALSFCAKFISHILPDQKKVVIAGDFSLRWSKEDSWILLEDS